MDAGALGKSKMLRPAALTLAVTMSCLCVFPATAFAAGQTGAAPTTTPAPVEQAITLRVNSGSVMVSDGGEFTTATNGVVLRPGNRLMVAEGGNATVSVGTCEIHYDTPGVHVIPRQCPPAAAAGPSGTTIGLIAGGAALAALALAGGSGGDDAPPPPVSR